ncbi:FAD:protein FMN transferase [Shimia sp. Alg240-R146]|uniref:FAD:protein FMN transferase n=1 Tax=Shimia sp. Alg240-R146 TaxID=2993449 RepID=UPI0022E9751F|nr:FAD:protein FMN transferase [Shimia sp. Alg240-R146]
MSLLNRRRFLAISACAVSSVAGPSSAAPAEWRGIALGAQSSLKISGLSQAEAEGVFAEIKAELDRLEKIFSLYHDSELTRLNREGTLAAPAPELLEVLGLADQLHRASDGAFDPTVQVLWNAHATGGDLTKAAALVRWSDVSFDTQAVTFARPGMALTLNGIAQGAITDCIAALLVARGLRNVLIDMGEIVALGERETGAPWRVGVITPDGTLVRKLTLKDRALATSAPDGFRLPDGASHILNPQGGAPVQALASIAAPSAALADGLSTAACLMTPEKTEKMVEQFAGAEVVSTI